MSLLATHDPFEKCQPESVNYPVEMGDFGAEIISSRLCDRFPVHFACFKGDSLVLTQLLNSGKFDLYEEDSYRGWTPAHWAAHCGQVDCLIQLQGVGVNLNVATQQQHQTPLHVAAEAGNSICLTLLLEQGVSIDIQDIHGETAAHKAARQGHVECLQLLRTQGGCFKFPFSVCNYQGQTPGEVFQTKGEDDMMCQSSGGDPGPLKAPSRKRVQFDDTISATKRAKFDDSGSTMEEAPPILPVTETNEYPMDFNEETVPKEYAHSLTTSTEGSCLPLLPNAVDSLPRINPHPKWKCQPFVI